MYTFSNRLKIASIILMIVGALGIVGGFVMAPGTIAEAKAMVAGHDEGHGDAHEAEAAHAPKENDHAVADTHGEEHDSSHDQQLFRVMEGITSYLVPGGIIVFVILLLSVLHMNHLFIWMDADVVAHDALLQGKSGYLNPTFFLIRAAIFLAGWIGYREYSRKLSLRQDESDDNSNFKLNFRISAGFLVFYLISESIMSWDWIMSVEPHWFSTLFGWYIFASMFVSGITVIAMVTIYLKSKGHLPDVNNSHIHDLAKFMFGISIFWTYL